MMLRARARAESTARDERGSCGGGGDEDDDDARERREHLFQPQLFYYRVSKPLKCSQK